MVDMAAHLPEAASVSLTHTHTVWVILGRAVHLWEAPLYLKHNMTWVIMARAIHLCKAGFVSQALHSLGHGQGSAPV